MANIFKTTLKKEVIADIKCNNQSEIRFPITKFWATRFADEYNLEEKTFKFKDYDTLELSSPSNKDTNGETFEVKYVRTYVDGDEFVVEFKANEEENAEIADIVVNDGVDVLGIETAIEGAPEGENPACDERIDETNVDILFEPEGENPACAEEINETNVDILFEPEGDCDNKDANGEEILHISDEDVYVCIKEWCNEKILNTLYDSESVFTTNASQFVILSNGRVIGTKKILPVNNDADIRIDLDMNKKVYYDPTLDVNVFVDNIYSTLEEICKNNFVFICRRYTGIFMDSNDRIYFGIKYSTRKSFGFKRKYNVQ